MNKEILRDGLLKMSEIQAKIPALQDELTLLVEAKNYAQATLKLSILMDLHRQETAIVRRCMIQVPSYSTYYRHFAKLERQLVSSQETITDMMACIGREHARISDQEN